MERNDMAGQIITKFIDDLDNEHFAMAIADFLTEEKIVGEFAVWVEKWKHLHGKGDE